jgi:hypothetical protein
MIPGLPTDRVVLAPEDYTVAQFDADIIDIILRFPDNTNPRNQYGVCLYEKEIEGAIERCLIGQWTYERGHDVPTVVADAGDVLRGFGYPESVRRRAQDVQSAADLRGTLWRGVLDLKVAV